jgi:cephalosporin hydroxylase
LTLTEIAKSNSSDKESSHKYFSLFYENELTKYQNVKISLLEIGIFHGNSLLIWEKFFDKAFIVGVDIKNNVTDKNKKDLENKNVKMIFNDAYEKTFVDKLENFDIIIDDGPHTEESQLKCLELYCNKIKKGGVLVIEDILKDSSSTKFIDFMKKNFKDLSYEFLDLRNKGASKPDNMLFVVRNYK